MIAMSHSSRVCGLKYLNIKPTHYKVWSHPSRVCGLKFLSRGFCPPSICVTPFTGVWIEIALPTSEIRTPTVTPFTGVWIEIFRTP